MATSDFRPEVVIRPFRACTMKNTQYNAYLWPNRQNFRICKEIGSKNTMVTSDFRPEVEIWPFHACAMRPVIIIVTVCSLWTDTMGQIPRSTERISSCNCFRPFVLNNLDICVFVYQKFIERQTVIECI